MSTTDPIADMLTRLRNGMAVRRRYVQMPSSKVKVAIAQILKDEGYIEGFDVIKDKERPQASLRIWLKYGEDRQPILTGLQRVSRPGRRVYTRKQSIPLVLSGIGISVLSTPKGIMTGRQARRLGLGGEVLCYFW
ncbi:MAG: 30S ribosomal protein S8 [Anaerolineae bacterium]|nr:30S ribosomal protein S8 [Anaerolineae bacterium]